MIKKLPLANTSMSLPLIDNDDDEVESPVVFYTIEARQTINHLVESTSFEVAWFGLVREETPNEFVVYKIYIPEQEVTAASVDITADAVAEIANQILDDGEDPSHMRYHGHSHVNMTVDPSGTDQEHMLDYIQDADWFIRSIHNKKGSERVDIFDKRVMLTHQCVASEVYEFAQTEEWFHKLDAEIKRKVKKQAWKSVYGNSYYKQNHSKQHLPITPSQMMQESKNRTLPYSAYRDNFNAIEDAEFEELMKDPFYAGTP